MTTTTPARPLAATTAAIGPEPVGLALIYGSTREGRLCETVSDWVATRVWTRGGFRIDEVDPLGLGLPVRHERRDGDAVRALQARIAAADAFIVVTPEYNHGYPAALKFLIDSVREPWQAKPVGFVSYGGRSGGIRAVEQLRQVFAELHTVAARDSVSLVAPWARLDAHGSLAPDDEAEAALGRLLGQLRWWATLLRDARSAQPYREVA